MNNILSIFLLILSSLLLSSCFIKNSNRLTNKLQFLNAATSNGDYPTTCVYSNDVNLANALCDDLVSLAKKSINEKGSFFVAVPGGSVLKMLSGLKSKINDVDWTKVFWFYVNHKCVPSNDETSTHFKAQKYFMKDLYVDSIARNVVSIELDDGIQGHDSVAHKYENRMKQLLLNQPLINNLPIIDLMIIGMGKDGHIGSLYPLRKEVTLSNSWVLTVDKKQPPSITLSLPVMNAARNIRVVLAGEDKAEACYFGIGKTKKPTEFPAAALTTNSIWMIDSKASTQLAAHKIPFINK